MDSKILQTLLTFLMGFCIGFMALKIINFQNHYSSYSKIAPSSNTDTEPLSTVGTGKQGEKSFYFKATTSDIKQALAAANGATPNILCMVIAKHAARGVTAILDTWTKHCDKVIVFSTFAKTYTSQASKVEIVPVDRSAKTAWQQTQYAYRFVESAYGGQYQWFVKVEDDCYLVVENLRQMLTAYRGGVEGYAGHVFGGQHTAGSIHALAAPTLAHLVTRLPDCAGGFYGGHSDDLELGHCLASTGGFQQSLDRRDSGGRDRFRLYMPEGLTQSRVPGAWYWQDLLTCDPSRECAADFPVTFHYVPPNFMYMLQYSVYRLNAYGTGVKTYHQP